MSVMSHCHSLVVTCAAIFVVGYFTLAVYRLFLHPLSRYPGSHVAAISTSWYEWYWNYHKNGRMLFEIERLHKQHGEMAQNTIFVQMRGRKRLTDLRARPCCADR